MTNQTLPPLPCPFCGGECDPEGWLANNGKTGPECNDCGATAESVEAWNRRAALAKAEQAEQRQEAWQGLSDEEQLEFAKMVGKSRHWLVAAVEEALREKNAKPAEQQPVASVPEALLKWAYSPELVETGNKWQQGYEDARAWVHVQLSCNDIQPTKQQAKQQPVAWSATWEGTHCGHFFFRKEDADEHCKRLMNKYPNERRQVVPLYGTPPTKQPAEQQHVCTVGSHWNGRKGFQVENFTGEAPPYGTKLYTTPPTQQALREAAFDKGFLLAASWAGRDDLYHDQGSRAYLEERDAALRGEGERE